MLKRAFLLTNRAHSIGNLTTALLLDDIGTIVEGLVDCVGDVVTRIVRTMLVGLLEECVLR